MGFLLLWTYGEEAAAAERQRRRELKKRQRQSAECGTVAQCNIYIVMSCRFWKRRRVLCMRTRTVQPPRLHASALGLPNIEIWINTFCCDF